MGEDHTVGNVCVFCFIILATVAMAFYTLGRSNGHEWGQQDALNGKMYWMKVETPEGAKFVELSAPVETKKNDPFGE